MAASVLIRLGVEGGALQHSLCKAMNVDMDDVITTRFAYMVGSTQVLHDDALHKQSFCGRIAVIGHHASACQRHIAAEDSRVHCHSGRSKGEVLQSCKAS